MFSTTHRSNAFGPEARPARQALDVSCEGASPSQRQLRQRLQRPQRHRLLQGYPALPLLPARRGSAPEHHWPDRARPLIVGVLPHTYCNPKVAGCGFCTFPHERYQRSAMDRVTSAVEREMRTVLEHSPWLATRQVAGVYFGGGTANLMPPAALSAQCRTLAACFDLQRAEVTLEGVPRYFANHDYALLDVLHQLPCDTRRISMGIQSFDDRQRRRMGRLAFGGYEQICQVTAAAREREMATSGDLLFNLPDQSLADMKRDIDRALAAGLDQICIYHLVLFDGLGTAWSRDPALLAAIPGNQQACDNWCALRDYLLSQGYVQSTLTNFEREEVARSRQCFRYERASFWPETFDAIGFGPGALSTQLDWQQGYGRKWMNAPRAADYQAAVEAGQPASRVMFDYSPADLKLLYLTRKLPLLEISRAHYQALFGTDLLADEALALSACSEQGLLHSAADRVSLTAKGMFYADAIAGLLAQARSEQLRANGKGMRSGQLNVIDDDSRHHMG